MEDKALDLLEKIYIELQTTKKELKEEIIENRKAIEGNTKAIEGNRKAIIKLELKIENEIEEKIKGLYDSREVINGKIDTLDEKIDKLNIDVNNLTVKTIDNDTKIIELNRNLKNVK